MAVLENYGHFESPSAVADYLVAQNLGDVLGDNLDVSPQVGGLANFVYRISSDASTYYLKQRPSFIKSRPEIPRDPEEIRDELTAYHIMSGILPGDSLPTIVHEDAENHLFISSEVQPGGTMMDTLLANGQYPSRGIASQIGRLVGTIHGKTLDRGYKIREEEREQMFYERQYQWLVEELPYKSNSTRQSAVEPARRLAVSPKALIWGDLTPKNITIGEGVGVVDLETVHRGDPAFDVGCLIGHILLEGLKNDQLNEARLLADSIEQSYKTTLGQYANKQFVDQVMKDAIVFSGTSIVHRTLSALIPESQSMEDATVERILNFADYLIKGGSYGEVTRDQRASG